MELSPHSIRATAFKTVRKGYDPDEVDSFREHAAAAVESAQNQATAMEARARAAVAKLQEVSQQAAAAPPAPPAEAAAPSGEDAEIISRTLLLAQRTADNTVAEARAEAESISAAARAEAANILDSARSMAGKLIDEARQEARRAEEDERVRAENEVQSLVARREFLVSDVEHLEQHISAQRERLRDAAVALQDLVERVPGGLGDLRRPLLSASGDQLTAPLAPFAPASPLPPAADPAGPEESAAGGAGEPGPDPQPEGEEVLGVSPGVAGRGGDHADEPRLWGDAEHGGDDGTPVQADAFDFAADITSEVPAVAPSPPRGGLVINGDDLN